MTFFMRCATLGFVLALAGCQAGDALWCGSAGCEFTDLEWRRLASLALYQAPPADPTNLAVGQPAAEALGRQLYFDSRLSGNASLVDMLGRKTQYARAAAGQPTRISCATCHVPSRGGSDFTSSPGNVSIGAGTYDVNSQPTVNAAGYSIVYWNGRADSLWAQAASVLESGVSMNGNRLAIAWHIRSHYLDAYQQVFSTTPLPFTSVDVAQSTAPLASDGTCIADVGNACPAGCRTLDDGHCVPRFPAQGKPGSVAGCQWGGSEPFGDAFDCMAAADRDAITRVLVNVGKAIAAYEFQLVSRDSAFDHFIEEGPRSTALTDSARRGAKLFVGKASCIECHSGSLFSDQDFHNVAVPQAGPGVPTEADCLEGSVCDCVKGKNCLPWGAYDGLTKLQTYTYRGDSKWSDGTPDEAHQRYYSMQPTSSLKGAWRTPTLRDVALTPPYMHDGLYPTLRDVVHHYNLGGAATGYSGTPSLKIRPLSLSDAEEADLVSFLEALTGAALPDSLTTAPPLP